MSLYDYRGIIHCHSTYSDGTGSFEEVVQAANDAGLDFLITSDHNTLKPKDDGHEKYQGSTLVLCGGEVSPESGNHYLAVGEGPFKGFEKLKAKKPQDVIDEVAKQGWLGFLSHPDHPGSKRFGLPAHPWTDWEVQNFSGMGLWSLTGDWFAQFERDSVTLDDHKEFESLLSGPRPETVKRWDALCQKRKVVGIGEADTHNLKLEFQGQPIQVFPYETAFRTVSNHVLLDKPLEKDAKKARKQLLDAIGHGRLYVSFDYWDDPTDFVFEIDTGDKTARMGDEITLGAEKTELVVALPDEALINVFHNGESIHEDENDEAMIEISQAGVYRVEAMRDNLTWILSNPIWVKK